MAFDLGDTVPLTTEVLDASGALTAASGVTCTVGLPDGTSVTPTVSNPSTGRYTVDYVPVQVGRHTERWTSTSPATARSDVFDVRPASPAYVISLADAKAHLNMTATVVTDDEELRPWLEATTEVIEAITGKVVVRRTIVERRRFACSTSSMALAFLPVVSLTSIVDLYGLQTWAVGGWDVDPGAGIITALAGTAPLFGLVQVTYVAGLSTIPARYSGAAKMIVRHFWESQRAKVGGQQRAALGGLPDGRGDMVSAAGWQIPRLALDLIGGDATPGFA